MIREIKGHHQQLQEIRGRKEKLVFKVVQVVMEIKVRKENHLPPLVIKEIKGI